MFNKYTPVGGGADIFGEKGTCCRQENMVENKVVELEKVQRRAARMIRVLDPLPDQ